MKYIIILGSGPGISNAVARKFGQEGYTIALVARNKESLKKQVKELHALTIDSFYVAGDIADENSLKTILGKIRDKAGHASMILYNAAAVGVRDILEQDWESIKTHLDVSVGGYFNLMKMVLPFCLKNNSGKLFVTGGGLAMQGDPQVTSLSIGKAALRNMVQAFQKRTENSGVHIAQLTVCGNVNPNDEKYNPDSIAGKFWELFIQEPGHFQGEIIY